MKLKKVATVIDWEDILEWEEYINQHQEEGSKKYRRRVMFTKDFKFKVALDVEEAKETEKLMKEKKKEYFGDIDKELEKWIEEREKFLAESMARAHEIWLK